MTAVSLAALALALSTAGWSATPRWGVDASVGGGFDDNLSAASASQDRVGSVYGQATAGASCGLDLGRAFGVSLAASYTGTAYLDFPDLSSHAAGGSLGLFAAPAPPVAVFLFPRVGGRWYGDDLRDALDVGGSAVLKVRLAPAVALRARYRYTASFAADEVYDRQRHQVGGGPELRLARRTWLELEYTFEVGQTVRYAPADPAPVVLADGPGTGTGKDGQGSRPQTGSDTFGDDWIATREPATAHTVVLDLEQGLGRYVVVRAWGGWNRTLADPAPFDAWFVHAAVGVRVP